MAEPYTVQALQIEISDNSQNVGQGVDKMLRSLERLKRATSGDALSGITRLGDAIQELVAKSQGLMQVARALNAIASAVSRLSKAKISPDLNTELDKLIQTTAGITQEQVDRMTELADAIERLSRSAGKLKDIPQLTGNERGGATATGTTEPQPGAESEPIDTSVTGPLREVSETADQATASLRDAGEAASEAGKAAGEAGGIIRRILVTALKSITVWPLRLLQKTLQGVGAVAKKAAAPVATLIKSFGRIAFYRLIRSAIKAITDGFSNGVEHIEAYSRAVGTELAPNMDKCRAATSYLTNSLGALAAPIINAVTPALVTLIDHFVTLTNLIGKFFAALSGATMFTQAKKDVDAYDKSLTSAGGSAKKLKDYTMGIDELNVIKEPSSGGGSGGKAAEDYSNMFEEVAIDRPIIALAERIKTMVTSGDWEGIGQFLGQKFNDLVLWVDSKHLGSKMADALNNAVSLFRGLITTIDWASAGKTVANFINDFFADADLVALGQTLIDTVSGALEFLYTWIGATKWGNIGAKLGELVSSIDFGKVLTGLVKLVGNIVKGVLDFVVGFLREFDLSNLARGVGEMLRAILTDVDWFGILVDLVEGVGLLIFDALTAPFDFGFGLVEGFFSDPIEEDLNKAIDITDTKAQEIRDKFDSIFDDYNSRIDGVNANALLADKYLSRLEELDSLPTLNASQMEEYQDLVSKLTDMFPDLTAVIDESTGRLEDGAAALRDQVESAIQLARIEAGKEKLAEIERTIVEAEVERNNVEGERERINAEIQRKTAAYSMQTWRAQQRYMAAKTAYDKVTSYSKATDSDKALTDEERRQMYTEYTKSYWDWQDMLRDTPDFAKGYAYDLALLDAQYNSLTDTINDGTKAADDWAKAIYGADDAADAFGSGFKGAINGADGAMTSLQTAIETTYTKFSSKSWRLDFESKWKITTNMELDTGILSVKSHGAQTVANALREMMGFDIKSMNGLATGGLVDSGEIFMARENGLTEYVGSFGNKTGVANNEQIVAGIAQGVAMAVAPLAESYMNGSDRIVNAVYANRTDVRIGDSDIANANGRAVANGGTQMSQGVFAFAR